MSETQQKFYDAVKDGIKDEIDKVQLTPGNLLALTTRLRQATIDPDILTSEQIPSIKIDRCIELVEELMSSKEKVVILSTFKQPVYILAEKLAQYCPVICTGDQTDLEISNNIDKFQTDNTHMILIGTLAKCSTGLTLNRASYMIMLDEH
jgi:SNF2 family DNA or RNA helicase